MHPPCTTPLTEELWGHMYPGPPPEVGAPLTGALAAGLFGIEESPLGADTRPMKHLKDAESLLKQGKSHQAMAVLEDILSLAPRNPEALRLLAEILDSWGRFDESFLVLQRLSQSSAQSEEAARALELRAAEEREVLVFSELTSQGRSYYSFPKRQLLFTFAGLLGCAAFLLVSPRIAAGGERASSELVWSFAVLVVVPWVALITSNLTIVKRILVGVEGLSIHRALGHRLIPWAQIRSAVVEHDELQPQNLRLRLYAAGGQLLADLDISTGSPVVRARRHFTRAVLAYVDSVSYISRAAPGTAPEALSEARRAGG